MVDPRVNVEFGQPLIGKLGPAFTPALDHFRAVPVPHVLAKTVLVHRAHGQHDMGMGLGHAVLGHVPMHVEIGDHAPPHEFALNEVAGELDPLSLGHLAGNGEFDLSGKLRVLPDLKGLTSFHSRSRSRQASGAFSGSITSEWTTPRLAEKS
jgi:hypothetical protein